MKRKNRGLGAMSDGAFCLLSGTLKVCCAMVLCGWAVLIHIGPPSPHTYALRRLAEELYLSPAGVLLVGNLCALLLEERSGGR